MRKFGWLLLGFVPESCSNFSKLRALCSSSKETMLNEVFFAKKTPPNAQRKSAAPPTGNCKAMQTLSVLIVHHLVLPHISVPLELNPNKDYKYSGREAHVVVAFRTYDRMGKIGLKESIAYKVTGYPIAVRNWVKDLDHGRLKLHKGGKAPESPAVASSPKKVPPTIAKLAQPKVKPAPVAQQKPKPRQKRLTQGARIEALETNMKELMEKLGNIEQMTGKVANWITESSGVNFGSVSGGAMGATAGSGTIDEGSSEGTPEDDEDEFKPNGKTPKASHGAGKCAICPCMN